jgi:hypothetical protein
LSSSSQNEDDDIKLKNRNIVLNFGEKGDDDEQEQVKEKWEPSVGSGNSTPLGGQNNKGGELNFGDNFADQQYPSKNKTGVDFYRNDAGKME